MTAWDAMHPKPPSEKVDGNSVCWTYRITNGDHDEAVRQILERWAEKEDEEE